jgi:hypothetical protein
MFSDPQTVTINAIANTLPRTGTGENVGTFTKDDGNLKMTTSHAYGKRTRRQIRLDHKKVAADPLIAAQNLQYSASIYIVVDQPAVGYTPTELKQIWDGFLANLSASSAANTIKFLGGES